MPFNNYTGFINVTKPVFCLVISVLITSQFYLFLHCLALVVNAVEGSDNVGVLGLAINVGQLEECVGGDGYECAVAIHCILMGIGCPIL